MSSVHRTNRTNWSFLLFTQLGIEGLPAEAPGSGTEEDVMKRIHHALFEVEVVQGELVCPETGRKFPIRQGIPNMLLNEDEI